MYCFVKWRVGWGSRRALGPVPDLSKRLAGWLMIVVLVYACIRCGYYLGQGCLVLVSRDDTQVFHDRFDDKSMINADSRPVGRKLLHYTDAGRGCTLHFHAPEPAHFSDISIAGGVLMLRRSLNVSFHQV